MEEKVFHEDNHVKITALRLTYEKDFVPLDQIADVRTRMKVWNIVFAFIGFLLSLFTFWLLHHYGLLVITFFFIWLYKAYSTYVELWITLKESEEPKKIMQASIANSQYIYKIEDALNEALEANKKLRDSGDFEYTDTMRIRQKLKQYE